jgi:integrase
MVVVQHGKITRLMSAVGHWRPIDWLAMRAECPLWSSTYPSKHTGSGKIATRLPPDEFGGRRPSKSAGPLTCARLLRGQGKLDGGVASWCINRRVDGGLELPLKLVQARLGHASIQMTADRYGHLFPSSDDGAELAAAEKALVLRSV